MEAPSGRTTEPNRRPQSYPIQSNPMKIATYLSVLAAAGFFAIGCDKKKDDPAPAAKTPEKTDPMPAKPDEEEKEAMPPKEEAAPTPPADPDPEPVVEPDAEPVVDPDSTPAKIGDEATLQPIFEKGLKGLEELLVSLEEATDVDDAVARLTALEPKFEALGAEMTAAGRPDDATAEKFKAQFDAMEADFGTRMEAVMGKLMGVDPSDPTAEPSAEVQGAVMGKLLPTMGNLMGHFEKAWPNMGNN